MKAVGVGMGVEEADGWLVGGGMEASEIWRWRCGGGGDRCVDLL